MKKVIILVALVAMVAGMSSCKKNCVCTERNTGVKTEVAESDMGGLSCNDFESILRQEAIGTGQDWSCK